MKKIYFALLAVAATLFVSCMQQEQPFDDVKFGENDVVFTFGRVNTKSADAHSVSTKGVSIPISNDGMGNGISLEETIEDLNPSPATKGAPAYTFNVGKLYPTMGVIAFGDDIAKEYEAMDMYDHKGNPSDPDAPTAANPSADVGDGWRYTYSYSGNPWPDENTPVDFYFNMPATPTGVSFTKRADKEIKFSFTSPTSGANQQDIIFSQASYSKSQHDGYLPNGAPVLMYHALTGVKFRNGHSNDGSTKTIITGVKFKGIASTGNCTIDLSATDKVIWENLDNFATFTMGYGNPSYFVEDEKGDYIKNDKGRYVEVEEGETGDYSINSDDGTVSYGSDSEFAGTSWTAAAADHNLNDEEGSLTFWFIPQQVDENATLEITFLVKTPDTPEGTEVTHIIKFGKEANADWKAGQLRTYTVKPFDVDVEIFDEMNDLTKDNLHVTNTGNVDEYVRIMVIGNWYGWKTEADMTAGKEPIILVGYESPDTSDDTMVRPWFREDDVYGTGFDNTFPMGRPAAGRTDWVRGTGSYFYYTSVIGAGQQLSGTNALFSHYELEESMIPTIYLPVSNQNARAAAVGVHLVMEIVVQAIPTTVDGEVVDCWTAWSAATGEVIKAK